MNDQPDAPNQLRAGWWYLAGLLIAVVTLSLMVAGLFYFRPESGEFDRNSILLMGAALPVALGGTLLMFIGMAKMHAGQLRQNLQAKALVQQALDPQQPPQQPTRLEKTASSPRGCLVLWLLMAIGTPILFLVFGLLLKGISSLFSGVPENISLWIAAGFLVLVIILAPPIIRQSAARLGLRSNATLPTLREEAQKIGRALLRFVLFAGLFGAGFWLYHQVLVFGFDRLPPILYLPIGMLVALVIFMGPLVAVLILPLFWLKRPLTEGDYDEVLRRLKVIERRVPMMTFGATLYKSLNGNVLLQAGRYAEAEAFVRQQMDEINKADVGGMLQYDSLNTLGMAAMEQGRVDEAETNLEAAIRIRPTNYLAYLILAELCLRQEGQAARALELLATALTYKKPSWLARFIDGNENLALIHMRRACALAQLGHNQEADTALEQAFHTFTGKPGTGRAGLCYWAGETRRAQGQKDAAVAQFQQAVELDPHGRIGELARQALAKL